MLIGEPAPTQADVHFRLFGFPVRVHPFFWLGTLLLGASGDSEPISVLVWVAVVFVSILVHELGHTFMQRHFGGRPWIVLHGFGGLAICGDCDRSPRSQILISLAGPAAGFLFALLLLLALRLSGFDVFAVQSLDEDTIAGLIQKYPPHGVRLFAIGWKTFGFEAFSSRLANVAVRDLLYVNIWWGLMNLLPIYPLDGGQISREVLTLRNPRQGIVLSLQVSIVTAAIVAVYALAHWGMFGGLMFAFLAYGSYQALRAYQDHYA